MDRVPKRCRREKRNILSSIDHFVIKWFFYSIFIKRTKKWQKIQKFSYKIKVVIILKVKLFDESHEKDLEEDINNFIKEKEPDIIDIKFSVSNAIYGEEQIYCFSALILYK